MKHGTDGNLAALTAHENEKYQRQKSFDALLPKAEALLREWVRDGETAPSQFKNLSPFLLADRITDDPYQYGLDNELVANLIVAGYNLQDRMAEDIKRLGDNAYDAWLLTPEASDALEDIVTYLEECEREDNDAY
jgi:hypothetical protein